MVEALLTIGLTLFLWICAFALGFAIRWTYSDFKEWKRSRRKKKGLWGGKKKPRWFPVYWQRSIVWQYGGIAGRWIRRRLIISIGPWFKAIQYGLASIKASRAILFDNDLWFKNFQSPIRNRGRR